VGEYRFATSFEESTRETKMFSVKLLRKIPYEKKEGRRT
jgi:hypothetical protein